MKIRFYKRNKTYGGAEYITLKTDKKEMLRGNTASTGWDYSGDLAVEVGTLKELREIERTLKALGVADLGRK